MNESFGSVHNRVNTNISITPVFDNLNGVKKGELFVNTFGGGTANTEFEFLTRITVGNLPYSNIPYNNINQNKYSVARYLKKLNYKTIAMHPYIKTNYNRDKIYNFFGFDDYITINDFKYTEKIHNFISDESMYNEIIDRFEMLKNNYNKTFIFGITIQNHSGYENYNKHDIVIDNDYKNFTSLKSYLSLLHKYDQAINILLNYFNGIDEHIVLCFFGDHNASFGRLLNNTYYDNDYSYECSNCYLTPYFIYDNNNNVDNDTNNLTSIIFLMNEIFNMYDFPLDDWQISLSNMHKKILYTNYHKCKIKNIIYILIMLLQLELVTLV